MKYLDIHAEGKGFHDDDEQEQIRSKERKKIADQSKDNTQRTPKFT